MAYYTALISAWNTGTVPANTTGSALTGQSTAQKLININGWILSGSVPTTFYTTGAALWNCVNWAEFAALTATQQDQLLQMCQIQGPILGGSANAGIGAPGMFLAFFNHAGATIAALTALAQATAQPWWQATVAQGGGGLTSAVNANDLTAAGGLT